MARRGELIPGDRVAVGSQEWKPVETIEALAPLVGQVWRDPDVVDAMEGIGSLDTGIRRLSLVKMRAMGLAATPQWAARLLLVAARLADHDDRYSDDIRELGSEFVRGGDACEWIAKSCGDRFGDLVPTELMATLVQADRSPRFVYELTRCLAADPRWARAALRGLWDWTYSATLGAAVRDALQSIEPEQLAHTMFTHDPADDRDWQSQSFYFESWLFDRLGDASVPPATLVARFNNCKGLSLHINCRGEPLTEHTFARLTAWVKPDWWQHVTVRNASGGIGRLASLLVGGTEARNNQQIRHSIVESMFELRIVNTDFDPDEYTDDDLDEDTDDEEVARISISSASLDLESCQISERDCDALSPVAPLRRVLAKVTVYECGHVPARLVAWLADHALLSLSEVELDFESENPVLLQWDSSDLDDESDETPQCSLRFSKLRAMPDFSGVQGSMVGSLIIESCRGERLDSAIADGSAFPALRILGVTACGLKSLGPTPLRLPMLTQLDLEDNRISDVSGLLVELPNLVALELGGNLIRSIGWDDLPKTGSLKSLSVKGNPTQEVPEIRPQLEKYDCSSTHIGSLSMASEVADEEWRLQELTVSATLETLPPGIGSLRNLERVELNGAQLRECPVELFALPSIVSIEGLSGSMKLSGRAEGSGDLVASSGESSETPRDLAAPDDDDDDSYCQSLLAMEVTGGDPRGRDEPLGPAIITAREASVVVRSEKRAELPSWLGALRIQKLYLNNFEGEVLPKWVRGLGLRNVHLWHCSRLGALPHEWFAHGSQLRELTVGDLPFVTALPDARDGAVAPQRLKELHLSGSGVTELPGWVEDCARLQTLTLDGSPVVQLPSRLMFTSITTLKIENCPITALPNAACDEPPLTNLLADGAGLRTLPDWLGRCPELEEISLVGCPIEHLPDKLPASLTKLRIDRIAPLDESSRNLLASLAPEVLEWSG